jgi:hypothetical protein
LQWLIERNIDYHRRTGRPFKLPVLIRSTMELVEQIARFRAPKYLSAYVDILQMHLVALDENLSLRLNFRLGGTNSGNGRHPPLLPKHAIA